MYRKHLVSRYSLGVLAKICSNSRLTRKLHKIELISAGPSDPDDSPSWRLHHPIFEKHHLASFLWVIFDSLGKDNRTPAVAVNDSLGTKAFGKKDAARNLQTRAFRSRHPGKIISLLVSEVAKTSFKLEKLELCAESLEQSLPHDALQVGDGLTKAAQICWSNLSVLAVGLGNDMTLNNGDALRAMLSSTVNLTTLRIVNIMFPEDEESDVKTLKFFAHAASHCPLVSFSLCGYSSFSEDLIKLLAPFIATLKFLEFENLTVLAAGCWSRVCRYILQNFRLTTLRLRELCRETSDDLLLLGILDDSWKEAIFEADDEERAAEILQGIAEHAEYSKIE